MRMNRLVFPAFVVLILACVIIVITSVSYATTGTKATTTTAGFNLTSASTEIESNAVPNDDFSTNETGTVAWSGVVTCPSQGRSLEPISSDDDPAHQEWVEDIPKLQLQPDLVYQTISGFGYSLTGGSAQHLMTMSPESRAALLHELFVTRNFNVLRISIGASDLDETPFSYSEGPGEFSIDRDKEYLIPALKEIQAIQPNLVILATPWSAPAWMKDNQSTVGGHLQPQYYQDYAWYFVKYLQAYQQEGIFIRKLTLQNEPMNYSNNPSMIMTIEEQATFLRDYLAPTLVLAGMAEWKDNHVFSTPIQILVFDHNPDYIEYPLTLLNDTTIFSIVEGSAFHLYAGDVASLSQVHDTFPTKSIHITEQWVSAHGDHEDDILWHGRNVLIGGLSNFAQTILGWNLSSNSALTPHTDGGCSTCLGAVTIDDTVGVRRNTAYYLLAHAAPYLPPGSVRIESTMIDLPFGGDDGPLHHVAFLTPSQHQVVLFTNEATTDYEIALPNGSRITVFGGSLMTIVLDSPRIL